jgi:NAD(P)H dehydrogenase (quinone)
MGRIPRILVMGATGIAGGSVVAQLKNNPSVQVIAAARDTDKARALGVPVVYLDLDRIDTFAAALQNVERVFMATGYTVDMFRQSKDLVNHARRAGVELIVHLGASGDDDTRVAHYGWHQFVERYIESSKLQFVHLRPETFMQNLLGSGSNIHVQGGVLRHYVGAARLSWVDCHDVAAVAVRCLLDPARHAGNTYRLGYDAKSCDEIAELMTSMLGQPFRYEARPPLEFLAQVLAGGAEPSYMKGVFDRYTDLTNGLDDAADETFDNFPALAGRGPRLLADFIREHADRFRY